MNKHFWGRTVIYGILQWIILNAALFVISLIIGVKEGDEMVAPPAWGFVILAVFMAVVANLFVRSMKLTSQQDATATGIIWSCMTLAFMAFITIANGTQGRIFSNWGVYAVFVSQMVGTILMTTKPPGQPPPDHPW